MKQKIIMELNQEEAREFLQLMREVNARLKKGYENSPKYINLDQFCKRYDMKKATIYTKTAKGEIPGMIRVGNKILFKLEDTDRWIESQKLDNNE